MHSKQSDYLDWDPPKVGFKVALNIASSVYAPDELTAFIGIRPTEVRHAADETRKYNRWRLESEPPLPTIQGQIDNILSRVRPFADRFANLESCKVYLSVYIYPAEFENYHHTHPSFDLRQTWMSLLNQMHATFVLD